MIPEEVEEERSQIVTYRSIVEGLELRASPAGCMGQSESVVSDGTVGAALPELDNFTKPTIMQQSFESDVEIQTFIVDRLAQFKTLGESISQASQRPTRTMTKSAAAQQSQKKGLGSDEKMALNYYNYTQRGL